MADPSLVGRLAALPRLSGLPRAQLEWLAAHGRILRFSGGEVMFRKGDTTPGTYVVLSGRFAIRLNRGGVVRRLREWTAGDISGRLPYSRMTQVPGDVVADEPVEWLMISSEDVQAMTRECYEFTALCVHEMIDRAREFKSYDLQFEKMASLGRLSAGLAHELNNPSSAVVRSAKEFAACRERLAAASRLLGGAALTAEQFDAVHRLEAAATGGVGAARSPMARADREDAIAAWLEAHHIDAGLSEPLADSAVEVPQLDDAARALGGPRLQVALEYLAAGLTASRLTEEIAVAASRIHSLVAAVKNFTHRDRAPEPEAVRLADHLADTITLLGSKARAKGITMELRVEPGLPDALGVAGELNQVWLNILDNAIDASPEAGHVAIRAAREDQSVTVAFVDNGTGIPAADRDRIFEPFFTTKPVGQGTGLGLDIAQRIVERHRGSIALSSGPGRTEFRITLPIAVPTGHVPT